MLPAIGNATLCGDRRGRGGKTRGFCVLVGARATLCGDRRGRGAQTRPSAEIGMVEVPRFFAFLTLPDEPSAEIVRACESLSLWRRANSS